MRAKRRKDRQEKEQQQRQVEAERRQQERTLRQTVEHIAQTLGETEERPRRKLELLVTCLGSEQALAYLEETQAIEERGGMLRTDGSSERRTPGGIFFFLVKQRLKEEQRKDLIKELF